MIKYRCTSGHLNEWEQRAGGALTHPSKTGRTIVGCWACSEILELTVSIESLEP